MPFISFSCLIAVVRTFNTVSNEIGESGRPCLAPNLRGKTSSFSLLSMMLPVGLSYMAFIMLRYIPSVPTLLTVCVLFLFLVSFVCEIHSFNAGRIFSFVFH